MWGGLPGRTALRAPLLPAQFCRAAGAHRRTAAVGGPVRREVRVGRGTSRRGGDLRVGVLGGNLAGLTCACYLALAGCPVEVLDCHDRAPAGLDAAQGELDTVLSLGIHFRGGQQPARVDGKQYAALYLASDEWAGQVDGPAYDGRLFTAAAGADTLPPAEAVAEGRRGFCDICRCDPPDRADRVHLQGRSSPLRVIRPADQ